MDVSLFFCISTSPQPCCGWRHVLARLPELRPRPSGKVEHSVSVSADYRCSLHWTQVCGSAPLLCLIKAAHVKVRKTKIFCHCLSTLQMCVVHPHECDLFDFCGGVVLWFRAAAAQRRRKRAIAHCSLQMYIRNIEMPAAVNEIVYHILISLNRVFVFKWCIWFRFGAPLNDPAQGRRILGCGTNRTASELNHNTDLD